MVRVPAVAPPPSSCRSICATVPLLTRAVCSIVGGRSDDQLPGTNQLLLVGACQVSCPYSVDDPIKMRLTRVGEHLANRKSARNHLKHCTNRLYNKSLLHIAIQVSKTCH